MDKKVIFSGMQPSGALTLGNYLGALNNWTKLQDEYNCLYCIVDLHSITTRHEPANLRRQIRDVCCQYIASGLDPEKNIIYAQSHVSAHAELAWILNCFTYMGELSRMTQFKEKSKQHSENINAGLFTYPILMAADILLYQTNLVPIGEDQVQHLEITRDIAERMNSIYPDLFTIPEAYVAKVGKRIMSLQEPNKKMSKSDENVNSVVYLFDEPSVITNKIKRAVTDSGSDIIFTDDKPGIKNLITIYMCVTEKTISEVEQEFAGCGYGMFKNAVAEAVVERLRPIQTEFKRLSNDKAYIDSILKANSEKAGYLALKTLRKVKKKIGFI